MLKVNLQLFGGRGAGSGGPSGSTSSFGENIIKGGSVSGDFKRVSEGRWESTKGVVSAVLGDTSSRDPQFEIVKGEYKGKTVYRTYQRFLNHKEFLFRANSPKEAVKRINNGGAFV